MIIKSQKRLKELLHYDDFNHAKVFLLNLNNFCYNPKRLINFINFYIINLLIK